MELRDGELSVHDLGAHLLDAADCASFAVDHFAAK